jgi:type I restriction enzyme S subunit
VGKYIWPKLPSSWQLVKLGNIAKVSYGKALTAESRKPKGAFRVYGSGGIVGKHDEFLFNGPSIIIGRKGSVGTVFYEKDPFWCIDTAYYLEDIHQNLDIEYLTYLLDFLALERLTIVVGVPGLNRKTLESITIPMPSLPEQKRIVEIFKQVDDLQWKQRKNVEKINQSYKILFIELFGDPVFNSKGYKQYKLSELGDLDRGVSKHRPRDAVFLYGGKYPFIQTGDVTNSGGWIEAFSQTYSEAGLAQSRLWPSGTLCITIAANIAKTGILEFDACFPDSVVGFLPNDEVTSEYVMFALNLWQEFIEQRAPQAAQKNINLKILRNINILKPPKDLQLRFNAIVHELRKLSVGIGDLVGLRHKLLEGAFFGELTTEWRIANYSKIEAWLNDHIADIPKRLQRISSQEIIQAKKPELDHLSRSWVIAQLSKSQAAVYRALDNWERILIASEDLDRFVEEWLVDDQAEDAQEQVRRALNQLVGLGLIKQVSLPNQVGEYVAGYRTIREDELTKADDLKRLGANA